MPEACCRRCLPELKPARQHALRDPLPGDCPLAPQFRFTRADGTGPYWMCDDCAAEGARWFVLAEPGGIGEGAL